MTKSNDIDVVSQWLSIIAVLSNHILKDILSWFCQMKHYASLYEIEMELASLFQNSIISCHQTSEDRSIGSSIDCYLQSGFLLDVAHYLLFERYLVDLLGRRPREFLDEFNPSRPLVAS